MSRRDPERIYRAQRKGLRNRLRDQWHLSEELADVVLIEWDDEAMKRGLARRDPASWLDADKWLEERLSR